MTRCSPDIELLPCPFCGSSEIQSLVTLDYVCCLGCGASLEDSEPSARALWNTRPDAAATTRNDLADKMTIKCAHYSQEK